MKDMNLAVEELLAIVIHSQGNRVKIPMDDFKLANIDDKVIAVDSINDGTVVVLTLVDREEVHFED